MTCSPAVLVCLAFTPVVVLAVHALFSRRFGRALAPQAAALLAALCAALPMALLLQTAGLYGLGAWSYAAAVYASLAYAYLHLFNLSETARRLKILFALEARGDASLDELEQRYGGAGAVLAVRLERMEALGAAHKVNGRWFLRRKTLAWAARIVSLWRHLLFT